MDRLVEQVLAQFSWTANMPMSALEAMADDCSSVYGKLKTTCPRAPRGLSELLIQSAVIIQVLWISHLGCATEFSSSSSSDQSTRFALLEELTSVALKAVGFDTSPKSLNQLEHATEHVLDRLFHSNVSHLVTCHLGNICKLLNLPTMDLSQLPLNITGPYDCIALVALASEHERLSISLDFICKSTRTSMSRIKRLLKEYPAVFAAQMDQLRSLVSKAVARSRVSKATNIQMSANLPLADGSIQSQPITTHRNHSLGYAFMIAL